MKTSTAKEAGNRLLEKAWKRLRKEARENAKAEPFLAPMLHERILLHHDFAESLAQVLAVKLADPSLGQSELHSLILDFYRSHAKLLADALDDLQAIEDRDPACESFLEPLLFFKGFQTLQAHRISHQLWKKNRRLLALVMQSSISRVFGVDIHPAAVIGSGIMLDHATNIVVGETARIGNDVSILHGVTLGGTGKDSGDRHPKISDGVMLGAHAQLLGNIRVGKGAKVGAGSVVLDNVAPHTTVAGVPAELVGRPCVNAPALEMNQDFTAEYLPESRAADS